MNNFRENNNDILRNWFEFREDSICTMCDADKKYIESFENVRKKILSNVLDKNKDFVEKQLNVLDKAFMDYLHYWNEKCYRNGFCDGVEIAVGCCDNK